APAPATWTAPVIALGASASLRISTSAGRAPTAPPATGGITASSSPSVRWSSHCAYSAFTAQRNDRGSGPRWNSSLSWRQASAAVAPAGRASSTLGRPTSSRGLANRTTRTFISPIIAGPEWGSSVRIPTVFDLRGTVTAFRGPARGRDGSLPEQVQRGVATQDPGVTLAAHVEAAHHRRRDPIELAHDELGGRRQLIGGGQHRSLQLVSVFIPGAAVVGQAGDPGSADGHVDLALSPSASEAVRDQDADRGPGSLRQALAQGRG